MQKLPCTRLSPKIIALDLDDTLLNNELKISLKTIHALQCVAARKVYIVICSGRTENAILPFVRALNIAGFEAGRYIIAGNGTSVYDLHRRETIYSRKVEGEVLLHARKAADKLKLPCQVYNPDKIFASADNEYTQLDAKLCNLKLEFIEDFDEFLKPGFSKMVIPGKPEILQELLPVLKEELKGQAEVCISKPFFLEVMPPNCGKGEALEFLASHVGTTMDEVMTFGDSMNDESMIRMARHSVAMINGLEEIKELAAYVTERSNNEDGIAFFLERFVL